MAARKMSAATHAKREAAKAKAANLREQAKLKKVQSIRLKMVKIELSMKVLDKRRADFHHKLTAAEEKLRKRWEVLRNKVQ